MVQRSSAKQKRLLRDLGANVVRWRKVNGMTTTELSERAFVTRETLRNIEHGTGAPRLDSVIAVLAALGVADSIVEATDPYRSETARTRIDDILKAGGTV